MTTATFKYNLLSIHIVFSLTEEKESRRYRTSKFLSEMKSKEVPETCYNAIKAYGALLTSTVVSNDDDIKTSKEEINKITSDVKLCGKIAEYNQATSNVGIQENIIVDPSGDGENIVEDDGSYPNGGGYPDGGGYPTGGVGGGVVGGGAGGVVGGGVIGPDLLALGYWFGQNITNSIITIAEGVKYCDTAGILFGQSALAITFTGPTLVNGILDSLGWYFFHVERLRPPQQIFHLIVTRKVVVTQAVVIQAVVVVTLMVVIQIYSYPVPEPYPQGNGYN